MFERKPQDGNVNEAGLQLVIDEGKAAGELPPYFEAGEIPMTNFVTEAAESRRLAVSLTGGKESSAEKTFAV